MTDDDALSRAVERCVDLAARGIRMSWRIRQEPTGDFAPGWKGSFLGDFGDDEEVAMCSVYVWPTSDRRAVSSAAV